MKIQEHKPTQWGTAVSVILTGDDVATAIMAYLVAKGVHVNGPRTVSVNGELCEYGEVLVDPSGFLIRNGVRYPKEDAK